MLNIFCHLIKSYGTHCPPSLTGHVTGRTHLWSCLKLKFIKQCWNIFQYFPWLLWFYIFFFFKIFPSTFFKNSITFLSFSWRNKPRGLTEPIRTSWPGPDSIAVYWFGTLRTFKDLFRSHNAATASEQLTFHKFCGERSQITWLRWRWQRGHKQEVGHHKFGSECLCRKTSPRCTCGHCTPRTSAWHSNSLHFQWQFGSLHRYKSVKNNVLFSLCHSTAKHLKWAWTGILDLENSATRKKFKSVG